MPKVNCAVNGCTSSTYQLNKWTLEICDAHHHPGSCITKENCKDCEKPFVMYCLPSVLKSEEKRKLWKKALKRENKDKIVWLPRNSDRVCSIHFIDGIPSAANVVPTLHLDCEKEAPKFRREPLRETLQKKRLIDTTEICSNDEININCGGEITSRIIVTVHSYPKLESANVCLPYVDKSNLIKSLVKKIDTLSLTVKKQKRNELLNSKQNRFSWKKVNTTAKMNFYTGLSSIEVFSTVFNLIEPYLPNSYFLLGWVISNAPSTKVVQ